MDGCTVAADDGERLSRGSWTSFQFSWGRVTQQLWAETHANKHLLWWSSENFLSILAIYVNGTHKATNDVPFLTPGETILIAVSSQLGKAHNILRGSARHTFPCCAPALGSVQTSRLILVWFTSDVCRATDASTTQVIQRISRGEKGGKKKRFHPFMTHYHVGGGCGDIFWSMTRRWS